MKDIFARCGCNCGRCPAYKENAKTEKDRQRCSEGWGKYLGAKLKPEICLCEGCHAAKPWKTGNVLPDRMCCIRPCAIKTGVKNCAYCYAFPCEDLTGRIPGEDFRERVESGMGEKMPEDDYLAFIEPYEGLKHLKEIRASLKPEDIVKKVELPPIRARIVDFPEDLPFSKKENAAFEAVHGLISKVLSPRADTYARQLAMKRRKHHILGFLWVSGLYGELKEGGSQLILDSKEHGSRAECRWMVRKRDNTLAGTMAQGFRILKSYGVKGEFVPSKKEWLMKLSFGKKAGGTAALKALKKYVTRLAEQHGEPVYAGSTRYKGKAFILFSKADMGILKGS
jgi:hypothetical protein